MYFWILIIYIKLCLNIFLFYHVFDLTEVKLCLAVLFDIFNSSRKSLTFIKGGPHFGDKLHYLPPPPGGKRIN